MLDRHALSITRACGCIALSRSAYYDVPINWTLRDAELISALAGLVEDRPRRGFWKCYKLLRRHGHNWNHKRVYRVYRAMKLNLRRRAKTRLPKRERGPQHPDTVWSANFIERYTVLWPSVSAV